MEDIVFLQCFRINNRLRVRIISPNYLNDLNCKFPRSIRRKDRLYSVKSKHVKLDRKQGRKDFYDITAKQIRIIEEEEETSPVQFTKIFTDEGDNCCCICLSDPKHYIFTDCGHYFVCKDCYDQGELEKCPICRSEIKQARVLR